MAWTERLNELTNDFKEVELKDYSSIGVGGNAKYFKIAENLEELIRLVTIARSIGAPYRIIGNGTNIIFSDSEFEGILIKNNSHSIHFDLNKSRVIADSGVPLMRLAIEAANRGLGGIEPFYSLEGTVGGGIVENSVSHGISIADVLASSSVMVSSEKILNCKMLWFKFQNRASRLKTIYNSSPPVVLSGIFHLYQRKKEDALSEIFKYETWRKKNKPAGKCCGPVFKDNCSLSKCPDDKTAEYLLKNSDIRKLTSPRVQISKINPNWIINKGGASAVEVRELIERMREAVRASSSINLVEGIEYLGNWNV